MSDTKLKIVTKPSHREQNVHGMIGVHLAEVTQMLNLLHGAALNHRGRQELRLAADVLNHVSNRIKAYDQGSQIHLGQVEHMELLHNLSNQILSTAGLAQMLKTDLADTPGNASANSSLAQHA